MLIADHLLGARAHVNIEVDGHQDMRRGLAGHAHLAQRCDERQAQGQPPVCRARQLRPDIVEQSADGVDRPRGQPARLLLHDQRSVPDLLHRSSAQQQGLHEAQRHRPDIEGIPATSNSTVRWFSDKMS